MPKVRVIMTNTLKKELRDFTSDICSQLAKEAAYEITNEAKNAMNDFYNDYAPTSYRRTYGFYYKSYKRYYNNNRSKYYYAGVIITIPPTTYRRNGGIIPEDGADFTKWDLLNLVYSGYHGMIENFGLPPIPPTTPSPAERINNKLNSIAKEFSTTTKLQSIMRNCSNNYATFKII